MRNFIVFAIFACAFLLTPLSAEASSQDATIAKAEAYLQSLTTARARFLQTSQDGNQAIGTFYLHRPGRLRFEYDPPLRDFVVADGLFIFFYDSQLGEQTNAPIGQTLADFLLRDNLRLGGDVTVTDIKRSASLLHITLVQTSDPQAGSLTLGFEENPELSLKKWRIVDSLGQITEVELFKIEKNVKLDPALFIYRDPKLAKPHRYNQ